MPWTTQIDPQRRLISTRATGVVDRQGAQNHRAQIVANPLFDSSFSQLIDLRAVERIDLSTDDIVRLASESILAAPARQAIVAPTDAMFGVSRMYYAYRCQDPNHADIVVCRTIGEAYARLGMGAPFDSPRSPASAAPTDVPNNL